MRARLFKPRFARLVEQGTKRQTIRPIPKRQRDIPRKGDLESWREWTGKPYRSKQRELCKVRIKGSFIVDIRDEDILTVRFKIIHDSPTPIYGSLHHFARADGFEDSQDMRKWFQETHGLPFVGILILAEDLGLTVSSDPVK